MRFTSLNICGFRGFNDAQPLDLSDPIAVFEGPNGSGKTSIGEAMEWLLYGKTLKRTKGDELSKREYDGCYKNTHYSGAAPPFVEATLEDQTGRTRTIRRELKTDETSTLTVDGAVAQDLEAFGIDTVYDRPLILQHTLQDFIFMKPKARYEVLSAMMGLEPLITFRNTVEAAKTEFGRRLPANITQAQNRRLLLVDDMRQEAVLVPVATLIDSGNLSAAKVHLQQVAQGLVQADTADADLLPALRTKKAEKERAQIDWGRFSGAIINSPAQNPAITHLAMLEGRVTQLRHYLRDAAATTTSAAAPAREQDPQRRQFYHLGLHLLDAMHPANCPFCANESLTPERIAAIREAVTEKPEGVSVIQQALAEVRGLNTDLMTQVGEVRRLVPNFPEDADELKVRTIVETGAASYLESITALRAQLALFSEAFERLHESQQAVEAALSAGDISEGGGEDLSQVLAAYAAAVCEMPGLINAYAANYSVLDPVIRARLASAADVKKIERAIRALEQWKDVEITQRARSAEKEFTDLIGAIRTFTEKKQGVGAGLHGFGLSEDADPLASSTAAGAQFPREFEGAPEVQDEISRRKLAGVRTSPRGARRRDTLALRRRDGRVETCAVWSAGRAEEILGPRDRDRIDAPARLPVALAPDRGLLAVGPGLDAPRPRSARSHHALAAESAPRSRSRSHSGPGASSSHRRPHGPVDRRRGRMGRGETRGTRQARLEEAPSRCRPIWRDRCPSADRAAGR